MISAEWLAGFFDGEGCVSINKIPRNTNGRNHQYTCGASVSQKNKAILQLIHEDFPEGRLVWSSRVWNLCFSGKRAKRFLEFIRNHSLLKRDQIEVALRFISRLNADASGMGHGWTLEEDEIQRRAADAAAVKDMKRRMYSVETVN